LGGELKEKILLKEYFLPKKERETIFIHGNNEEEIAENLIKILKEKNFL
jgi:hypothetical protein